MPRAKYATRGEGVFFEWKSGSSQKIFSLSMRQNYAKKYGEKNMQKNMREMCRSGYVEQHVKGDMEKIRQNTIRGGENMHCTSGGQNMLCTSIHKYAKNVHKNMQLA